MKTKVLTREYLDEALANFRLSLNKDMLKFATKDDVEEIVKEQLLEQGVATRKDLENLKTELKDYVHEVADQIVGGFDATMTEHLTVYHSKSAPASH